MTTKYFDVATKQTYTKEGQPKTRWFKVGKLIITPTGKAIMSMYDRPETPYFIFEQKKREVVADKFEIK